MLSHLHLHFNFLVVFSVLEKYVKPAEFLYGRLIRVWVLIFPFFAVIQPEDLQTVLSSRKHTEKIFFYRLLHNFLGNGLITSSGNFTFNHMDFLFPTIKILFVSARGLQLNLQLKKKNPRLFKKIIKKIESSLFVRSMLRCWYRKNMWSKFIVTIQQRKHVFNEITAIDREWAHTHAYLLCSSHLCWLY